MSDTPVEAETPVESGVPEIPATIETVSVPETSNVIPFPHIEAFPMPKLEVPTVVRELAEKSVTQARENYEKVKAAAEEATDVLEDTYETARKSMLEFNLKAIDTAKSNSDATFEFVKNFAGVKTLSEAVELQSAFARKQFESLTAQAKEFQELATKLSTDATSPLKDAATKIFKDFKVG
ncbi:phasin [Segnochrobactraceae bacterium EtOH-i3]